MTKKISIIQYADENKDAIACLRDRIALWIFGYIYSVEPIKRRDLRSMLQVSESEDIDKSVNKLVEADYLYQERDGLLTLTDKSEALASILNLEKQMIIGVDRGYISCDLFRIDDMDIANAPRKAKEDIINELVTSPQFHGREGNRYGFVECKSFGDDILYGYFTQEYRAHFIDYDDNIRRRDEWPTKFSNTLFIWPLDTQMYILQDKKFFGAPTLSMGDTRTRIQLLMKLLCEKHMPMGFGNLIFKPFERELSKDEMLDVLLKSSESVTETSIELGSVTSSIIEKLPIFNPREDWNEALTEIIKEYEIPNIANARFSATRQGTLGNSKLVKSLALAGRLKTVKLGRGKSGKTIRRRVPTHVARVEVNDPATQDDIVNILRFLKEKLGLNFGHMPEAYTYHRIAPSTQMRLAIEDHTEE